MDIAMELETGPVAWFFPGQGSQFKGMGGLDLFGSFPDLVRQADDILGYSITSLCLNDEHRQLGLTQFTQPALYVVNALSYYQALRSMPKPDYLAGHSLGEYNALHAAGCFDFETGLRLVVQRSQLMAMAQGGGMAAVSGLDVASLKSALSDAGCSDLVEIANINSAEQIVVSGDRDAIDGLCRYFRQAKIARAIPLAVSAAFHSRYMNEASAKFRTILDATPFNEIRVPVVANVTGEFYPSRDVRSLLGQQLHSGVRWWDTLKTLRQLGVARGHQFGPGTVLAKLWQEALQWQPPKEQYPSDAIVQENVVSTDNIASPPSGIVPTSGKGRLGLKFCRLHGVMLPYVAGSMFRGIASPALVERMSKAGLLSFFGSGGLTLDQITVAIKSIAESVRPNGIFGVNLLANPARPEMEWQTVNLLLDLGVRYIEASAFTQLTASIIKFRFRGAKLKDGRAIAVNKVFAKISRTELATAFLSPPTEDMLDKLQRDGHLSEEEVSAARRLPVASDLSVESDSGGHTDGGITMTLLPTVVRLRNRLAEQLQLDEVPTIGAAGGLGTPEAIAAAFVLGAEFITVGSINQCSLEAGTSPLVKDMLAELGVHDTAYAPAGDVFVTGAKVQVVKRGTLFAARGNQLYQAYRTHEGIADLPARTRDNIERFMGLSLDEIWKRDRVHLASSRPKELEQLDRNQKARMARIFKWYFSRTIEFAINGEATQKANFQIHSGPAIGAFNSLVLGTDLQNWNKRHVDIIAHELMSRTEHLLTTQFLDGSNYGAS